MNTSDDTYSDCFDSETTQTTISDSLKSLPPNEIIPEKLSIFTLQPEFDEPCIYHPSFCGSLSDAKLLAQQCGELYLSFIKDDRFLVLREKHQYVLEFVRKADSVWRLRIRFDVCRWIDYLLQQPNAQTDIIVANAKSYAQHLSTTFTPTMKFEPLENAIGSARRKYFMADVGAIWAHLGKLNLIK